MLKRILIALNLLILSTCTIESDPRAVPIDFGKRALRYNAAWSKKSLEVKLRDGGSLCITMTSGCLCNIQKRSADGAAVLYENKQCIVGAAADAEFYRLGLNCYTPIDEDGARSCKSEKGTQITESFCEDSNAQNKESLLFRMGFSSEPVPVAVELSSSEEFNPESPQSPAPVAHSLIVHAELDFCSTSF